MEQVIFTSYADGRPTTVKFIGDSAPDTEEWELPEDIESTVSSVIIGIMLRHADLRKG